MDATAVVLGNPLTTPVFEKLNPVGSAGDTVCASVPKPPVAVTGLNCVNDSLTVKLVTAGGTGLATLVSTGAASTLKLNVPVKLWLALSLTVTV